MNSWLQMVLSHNDLVQLLSASGLDDQGASPREALVIQFGRGPSPRLANMERADGGTLLVTFNASGDVVDIEFV